MIRLIGAGFIGGAALFGAAVADEKIGVSADVSAEGAQSFDFSNFSSIEAAGVFDIEIAVGGDYSIELSGPEKELSRVTVTEEDGVLILDQSRKKDGRGNREGVDVTISMPSLKGLVISGVAEVEAEGIDAESFKVSLSGVGDVELEGTCGSLSAKLSGVGDLDAQDLSCRDVSVKVSGVGEATVTATESVDADVSGMGSIEVYGSPKEVSKSSGLFSSIEIK